MIDISQFKPVSPSYQSMVVDLTPELARTLLSNAPPNRPIHRQTVDAFKRALNAGRWFETGDPIQLDREYGLLNGRHRCTAVAETGIAIKRCNVHIGIDPTAASMMDTGKKRHLADTLSFCNAKNTGRLSSIVSLAWAVDTFPPAGYNSYYHRAPPNDIGRLLYERDRDAFDVAVAMTSRDHLGFLTVKISGWLMYVTNGEASDWIQSVVGGGNLVPETGAHALHQRIVRDKGVKGLTYLTGFAWALVAKAYLADWAKKKVGVLRVSPDETIPKFTEKTAPRIGRNNYPLVSDAQQERLLRLSA